MALHARQKALTFESNHSPSCTTRFTYQGAMLSGTGLNPTYRRWAGKTSYVHLAPKHVFTIKHLISFMHVRGPQINQHKPLHVFLRPWNMF